MLCTAMLCWVMPVLAGTTSADTPDSLTGDIKVVSDSADTSVKALTDPTSPTPDPEPGLWEKIGEDPHGWLVALLVVIAIFIIYLFRRVSEALNSQSGDRGSKRLRVELGELKDELQQTWVVLLVLLLVFAAIYVGYFAIRGTGMEAHIIEWLNLIVRWAHVVAGISWIGASFYFIFLENSLNRTENLREGIAGDLWAVHGGGFYFLEKYKVAPEVLPKKLHWFKYEAYFTWITGFILLYIVYYMNPGAYLVDPVIMELDPQLAVGIGISSLIVSWLVYDLLCKSELAKNRNLFSGIVIAYIIGIAFVLAQLFNSRAAYIHVGAIIGTIMAANVFFVIIPGQKAMVRAAKTGQPLDPTLGQKAGLRSLHNNYFTLPVIFIMISNHFPSTFGHEWNWVILGALSLASVGIKHFWNLLEKGNPPYKLLALSVVAVIALAIVTSPVVTQSVKDSTPVSFPEAQQVINDRCVSCHSAYPSDDVNTVAPNGIMFDTPEQIIKQADRIMVRTVVTRTMPQANKTGMTPEERDILRRWIEQGAKPD